MDLFVAVTNDDENNIMSCCLPSAWVRAASWRSFNRRSYVDLLQAGQIDIAIFTGARRPSARCSRTCGAAMSPRCTACAAAWRKRSRRWCTGIATLAAVSAGKIEEIDLPKGAAIAAIVRGDKVVMAHPRHGGAAEDHVIVFVNGQKGPAQGGEIVRGQRRLRLNRTPRAMVRPFPRSQRAERPDGRVRPRDAFCLWAYRFMYGDAARQAHYEAVLITFVSGATLWVLTRSSRAELQTRDGFLLVALVWTVLPAFATLPLFDPHARSQFHGRLLRDRSRPSPHGSTVLSGLDKLPPP